jgi:hypothetical protein
MLCDAAVGDCACDVRCVAGEAPHGGIVGSSGLGAGGEF